MLTHGDNDYRLSCPKHCLMFGEWGSRTSSLRAETGQSETPQSHPKPIREIDWNVKPSTALLKVCRWNNIKWPIAYSSDRLVLQGKLRPRTSGRPMRRVAVLPFWRGVCRLQRPLAASTISFLPLESCNSRDMCRTRNLTHLCLSFPFILMQGFTTYTPPSFTIISGRCGPCCRGEDVTVGVGAIWTGFLRVRLLGGRGGCRHCSAHRWASVWLRWAFSTSGS
jgi:hypothetical protein